VTPVSELKQEVPMRKTILKVCRRCLFEQQGATAIEYALIAAGIAAAIIISVNALGVSVVTMWTAIANALS
jgi:pilus assembly protein Flp/PilA